MKAAEFEKILILLAESRVEFVVIGGVAAMAHGVARVTYDVDVCYHRSEDNIERLCRALQDIHPTLRGAPPDLPFKLNPATVKSGLNFTLATDLGDLDLLGEVAGLGEYEAVRAASETLAMYGNHPMQILTIEGLLSAKHAAGRAKDIEVILELEALLELRKRPPG